MCKIEKYKPTNHKPRYIIAKQDCYMVPSTSVTLLLQQQCRQFQATESECIYLCQVMLDSARSSKSWHHRLGAIHILSCYIFNGNITCYAVRTEVYNATLSSSTLYADTKIYAYQSYLSIKLSRSFHRCSVSKYTPCTVYSFSPQKGKQTIFNLTACKE